MTKELLLANKGFSKKEYEKMLQDLTGEGNADILINRDATTMTPLGIVAQNIATKIEAQTQQNLAVSQKFQKTYEFGLSLIKKVDTTIDTQAKNCIIFLLRGSNDDSPQKFQVQ